MFGAYYYGFVDRDDVKGDLRIGKLAKRMDRNDFMFSNSPYSLLYERPLCRGLVVVHSDSPPSPPMTLEFPTDRVVVADRQAEFVGAYVSTDPGVEGIDQFGTNTFGIRTWMESENHLVEVQPQRGNEDVEGDTEFENRRVEPSQQPDEDVETDTEFENRRVEPSQQADDDVETDTKFKNQQLD
jgi:hypothetical protein